MIDQIVSDTRGSTHITTRDSFYSLCLLHYHSSYREIDIGETQRIDAKRADEVKARISAAQDYLANVVAKDPELRPLLENCKLEHEDCAFWSVIGA